ncbi:hypothetical protein LWI28_008938 [Acer negundo]|uniref:Uncharacterized protein n=1 Tax=Acer negundo TaxID=4023 RepID=A0AAD5ILW3_ACENE|nr:hypothetical protein LWI28_008938 [Acer negundo]KAK4841710.1 hypothetical protein QYF36_009263 [Acer negundo]
MAQWFNAVGSGTLETLMAGLDQISTLRYLMGETHRGRLRSEIHGKTHDSSMKAPIEKRVDLEERDALIVRRRCEKELEDPRYVIVKDMERLKEKVAKMRSWNQGALAGQICIKFIERIANKLLTTKFRHPAMVEYHEGQDPVEHVSHFETLMEAQAIDLYVWREAFPMTLGNLASR